MQGNYSVEIKSFAERHFIKSFAKKYHRAWDVTLTAIIRQLEHIDNLSETNVADIISSVGEIKIIKTDFRVAGTKESAKSSGNRTIVVVNESSRTVNILLVYCKTDVKGSHETNWWKSVIRQNYPEYKDLL